MLLLPEVRRPLLWVPGHAARYVARLLPIFWVSRTDARPFTQAFVLRVGGLAFQARLRPPLAALSLYLVVSLLSPFTYHYLSLFSVRLC